MACLQCHYFAEPTGRANKAKQVWQAGHLSSQPKLDVYGLTKESLLKEKVKYGWPPSTY
jgi:hypothetical protein